MTCTLCSKPIALSESVNLHHPVYRSNGGTDVEPAHQACHVRLHSQRGDFRRWGSEGGKLTAATRRWSLNLKNVKDDPAHEMSRAYYRSNYSH